MNVAIVGLGPVGIVTAAGLARAGHRVFATDREQARVEALRAGATPVSEPGLATRVRSAVAGGSLVAADSIAEAMTQAALTLVCVGTPPLPTGDVDLAPLVAACASIGAAFAQASTLPLVVVRSTVPPGTTRGIVAPALGAASGGVAGSDFHVAMQPEFLREGNALADFDAPPKLVIGADAPWVADAVVAMYAPDPACEVIRGTPESAELAKYADNAWHALKVAYANEIGALARALAVDGDALLAALARDRALNVSPAYLRPGAPFGGSCLPKDVAALGRLAARAGVRLPLLGAILTSNRGHLERVVDDVAADGARRVGIVGLAFKPGTADLRESPYVSLARALASRGIRVRVWDDLVRADASCDPAWFAASPATLAAGVDTVVVCHGEDATLATLAAGVTARHAIVDLTGRERDRFAHAAYRSVAWRPERTQA